MRPKGMAYVTTLLGAGVIKVPGLHESTTATGNTGSRAQAASEFARLERERVRLEDKLSALAVTQSQTETRLDALYRRMAMVRLELDEIPAEAAALASLPPAAVQPRPARARPAPRAADGAPDQEDDEDDFMEPFEVVPFTF